MLLDATTKSLEVVLAGAVTTTQAPITAFYVDHTASASTPGSSDIVTNNATAVTAVAAPNTSTQRQVKMLTVYNADTAAMTVQVQLNNNSTARIIGRWTLAVGESLVYQNEVGFCIYDVTGLIKAGGTLSRQPDIMKYVDFWSANLTTVTASYTSGKGQLFYMGVCSKASSSIDSLVNVTTAVATITWAEVAIFKGTPTLNAACPDLTRLGYADVSGVYNGTGVKKVTIPLTVNAQVGDNLWLYIGAAATTMLVCRGGLANNLQSGTHQTLAQRPSLYAGPGAGTIAANNLVPTWCYIKVN
jgi:hypothetical protein